MKKQHKFSSIVQAGAKAFDEVELTYCHGTDNSLDEAIVLAAHVLDINLLSSNVDFEVSVSSEEEVRIMDIFEQRIATKSPAPFLTNRAYFVGREYYVDERVMIPRSPFGELIQKHFRPWLALDIKRALDLCTGSGVMAIALAHEFTNINVDAADISEEALTVAKKNVEIHNMGSQVKVIQSDLFDRLDGPYDIIMSNPPYVSDDDYNDLPEEFSFEPKLAFTSDEQGLEIVSRILQTSAAFLSEHAILVVEVGAYKNAIEAKYSDVSFTWIELEFGGEGIFVFTKQELLQNFANNI